MEEPVEGHQGGSGGQGTPNRMTFTVIWYDSAGTQIGDLDLVLPAEWQRPVRTLGSQPDRTRHADVRDVYLSRRHRRAPVRVRQSGPRFGHRPRRPRTPTATYAVTVDWNVPDWTIEGADGGPYSARDLCPRGSEAAATKQAAKKGGGHEEGGEEGGVRIPCLQHTVAMRQVVPGVQTPSRSPAASRGCSTGRDAAGGDPSGHGTRRRVRLGGPALTADHGWFGLDDRPDGRRCSSPSGSALAGLTRRTS